MTSKLVQQLNEMTHSLTAAKQAATETAQKIVAPMLQQFLKDHPVIKTISWTQYTPYFNDGDTCTFSVGEIYFSTEIFEDGFDYNEQEEKSISAYSKRDKGEYFQKYVAPRLTELGISLQLYDEIHEMSAALHDSQDLLEDVFGDHVAVVVTAEGIDVQEYEHD